MVYCSSLMKTSESYSSVVKTSVQWLERTILATEDNYKHRSKTVCNTLKVNDDHIISVENRHWVRCIISARSCEVLYNLCTLKYSDVFSTVYQMPIYQWAACWVHIKKKKWIYLMLERASLPLILWTWTVNSGFYTVAHMLVSTQKYECIIHGPCMKSI